MRLIYKDTNNEVRVGDVVKTFRGDSVEVVTLEKPYHSSSTGRVYVKHPGSEWTSSYFPSVIGAEWIERADSAD